MAPKVFGSAPSARRAVLGTVTNIIKPTVKAPSKVSARTSTQPHKKPLTYATKTQHVNTHFTMINDLHDSSNDTDNSEETKLSSSSTTTTELHSSDDTEIEDDDDCQEPEFVAEASPSSTVELVDDLDNMILNPPSYCVTVVNTSRCNPDALCPIWDKRAIEEKAQLTAEFENMPGIFDETDEDTYDIAMAAEYSNEIFEYMRELEFRYLPDVGYMEHQIDLDWNKRGILMEWLVRVHDHCNFLPETLFLTAHYVDRFLSLKPVRQNKLQLVGVVSLFVAAKYEEITCPSVQEIAYMVDNAYSVDEILRAERYMINLLEFNLGWPGPMSFLRRSSKADDYDSDTRTLAKYLLEITIMDERFVGAPPSWLAASAHYLSRKILSRGPWSKAHAYFSGYSEEQLEPAVAILIECCRSAEAHHKAIFRKYRDARFKWVSLHVARWISEQP